jgi:hypothetical protein
MRADSTQTALHCSRYTARRTICGRYLHDGLTDMRKSNRSQHASADSANGNDRSGVAANPEAPTPLRAAGQEHSIWRLGDSVLEAFTRGALVLDPHHGGRPEVPRLITSRGTAEDEPSPRGPPEDEGCGVLTRGTEIYSCGDSRHAVGVVAAHRSRSRSRRETHRGPNNHACCREFVTHPAIFTYPVGLRPGIDGLVLRHVRSGTTDPVRSMRRSPRQ